MMDRLVVINTTMPEPVASGHLWLSEILDVHDVCDWEAIGCLSTSAEFVELIVKHNVLLVLAIENRALVDVTCSWVCDLRDDVGDIGFVRDIVDGQRIFVVAIADITAFIALVWAVIHDALRIMNVSVASRAAERDWVGRILDIEEVET